MTGIQHRFSVIIPTRERADTFEKALHTVTAQDYDNLEIIISDNCSADGTRDVAAAARDPRVRYLNTGRRVSMSDNWEFSLGHTTGDWITVVGDDDGLLPGCLGAINDLIQASGAEAIRTRACMFDWPSVTGGTSGRLHIPLATGWERRPAERWRQRVLAGISHYHNLPMLYTGGFVSASVIDRVRSRDGRFFRSSIPDVYSALLLSRVLPEYVFSSEPVAIFGISGHSTGLSQFRQPSEAAGSERPVAIFIQEDNIPFHPGVPMDASGAYPRAVHAFIYESYLQVAEILQEPPTESPARQLMVTLATARGHHESVQDWGHRFAAMHGLDFDTVAAAARRYATRLAVRGLPAQIMRLLRIYSLGSEKAPIRDIYEASIVAGVIKGLKPSRLPFVLSTIRERLLGTGQGRLPT